MSLDRLSCDAPIDKLVEVMERDGAVIVEQMVGPDVVEPLRDAIQARARERRAREIEPGAATQGLGEDGKKFVGAHTIRFSSIGTLTPAFFSLLENPVFGAVDDALLLPHCGSY